MQSVLKPQQNQDDFSHLSKAKLLELLASEHARNIQIEAVFKAQLKLVEKQVDEQQESLRHRDNRILLLEELLRLRKIQKFTASSEKLAFQISLSDEADTAKKKIRKRGFSASLERLRIELTLSDEQRAGASSTFFTKVKEELDYIPAKLQVLEYWREKPSSQKMTVAKT